MKIQNLQFEYEDGEVAQGVALVPEALPHTITIPVTVRLPDRLTLEQLAKLYAASAPFAPHLVLNAGGTEYRSSSFTWDERTRTLSGTAEDDDGNWAMFVLDFENRTYTLGTLAPMGEEE